MELMMIIVAIVSACVTYFISFNLKKGAVMASAIVTLCSGIFLPYLLADGATLATVATTASYAAMVSQKKFPKITDMIFVGIICGTLFGLVQDVYVGVGGKLGTMAAISGFAWLGIRRISGNAVSEK